MLNIKHKHTHACTYGQDMIKCIALFIRQRCPTSAGYAVAGS